MTAAKSFCLPPGSEYLFNVSMSGSQRTAGRRGMEKEGGSESQMDSHNSLLMAVAQQRDRQAFVALFNYFAPRVKSFLMKGGIAPDAADELAQETMLAVWKKAASFNHVHASASTWIFTIARNKRIDFLRRAYRPEPDANDPSFMPDAPDAPDQRLSDMQDETRLKKAMRSVPKEQAELLYKSFFEEKTHKDIAEETKLPLGTVKSRIRLAIERLRNILAEDGP